MSPARRTVFVLALICGLLCFPVFAQPASNPAAPVKSPVALFRELLAMSPEQRKVALASRPPENQKRILEKVEEYQILPEELRELRLRETELRWYLRPVLDEPRTNRAALLERMTTLRIAMRDGFDSLNVAAASAVAMHHFFRE